MKTTIFTIIILVSSLLFGQTSRSYPAPKAVDYLTAKRLTLSDFGLKGKVKTYKGVEWDARGYSPHTFTWSFNEQGQLVTQHLATTKESQTGYKYDPDGKLIECSEHLDGNYKQKFVYDNAGYLSMITDANEGISVANTAAFTYEDTTYTVTKTGKPGIEIITYNSLGKPVSAKSFSDNGFNTRTLNYNYVPAQGNTIIFEGRDTSKDYSKIIEKRDDAGRLIEFSRYDIAGELVEKHEYIYDKEGRCIADKSITAPKGPMVTKTYKYTTDEMGNVVKVIVSGDSKPYEFNWEIAYY